MVLPMARPWKHPDTGIYYFRKAVPLDLRPRLKKREEKRSLGTRDPDEARSLHMGVAAEVDASWRRIRAQAGDEPEVRSLTQKQVHAMAGEIYRLMVAAHEDEPGRPERWKTELRKDQYAKPASERAPGIRPPGRIFGVGPRNTAIRRHGEFVDAFLSEHGIALDRDSRERLIMATASALEQAHGQLLKNSNGDYSADPRADRFPEMDCMSDPKLPPVRLHEVFEVWSQERGHAPSTRKRWISPLRKLMEFAGTDDLRAITEDHMIAWKNHLVAAGRDKETIACSDLGPARNLFAWCVANRILDANPAANVRIKVPRETRTREQGFTKAEAETILRATFENPNGKMSPEGIAARRWVPWLCAYTGARVNEITQARGSDLRLAEAEGQPDVWVLRITPDAGTVKDRRYRDVALHPHLIEQGFIKFAHSRGDRPLFYDPSRKKNGTEANPQFKKAGERLAAWVRKLGIKDKAIGPNHAWRHRFKSMCDEAGVPADIRDMIQGHVPRTVGESYGDLWPHVMLREISKLPLYDL